MTHARRLGGVVSHATLGFLLATVPAPTLLATLIVTFVRRSTSSWCLSARHVSLMVCGASMIVVPQAVLGRWSLELLLPWSWILAFCVGARAGRGRHALSTEAKTHMAKGAMAGVLVTLLAMWVASPDGSVTWLWLTMHENQGAARLAVLALAIPVLAMPFRASAWLWLVAAVGAISVGSRAVLAGVVLGTAAGWLVGRPAPGRAIRIVTISLGLAGALLAVSPPLRMHIIDGVLGVLPEPASVNLVPGSEDIGRPPWLLEGVRVETIGRDAGGYAIARVTKTEGALGSRPIVAVDLKAGQPYIVTVILEPEQGSLPGVRMWAPASGVAPAIVATVGLDDGRLVIGAAPGMGVGEASVEEVSDGGWYIRFRLVVLGDQMRRLWVGPAPDLRDGSVGASVRVSRLQIVAEEHAALGYVPTHGGSESATTARSRLEIFAIAGRGLREAPWLGHGFGAFEGYQRGDRADAFAFGHAHNLMLQVLFETGLLGLAGFTLLGGAMIWPGRGRRVRPEVVVLVISVAVMNAVDYTFVSADITMGFAAALGLAGGSGRASVERGSISV